MTVLLMLKTAQPPVLKGVRRYKGKSKLKIRGLILLVKNKERNTPLLSQIIYSENLHSNWEFFLYPIDM